MTQNIIYYIYCITNIVNGKVYIGQTVNPSSRWYGHKSDAAQNNPNMVITQAIKKYGNHNFKFEVIFSCKSQDDVNWAEEEFIKKYDSLVKNGKGYNVSLGGMVAPKSDEWKQAMKDWHASLSEEERFEISEKQSEATQKQITTKGHPAQGTKRTPEQIQNLIQARKDNPVDYTPEIRKNMSEAHIGIKDSEETKKKKSEKAKLAWEKRINYDDIKCSAPGCEVHGKASYKFIDNIRYCNKHGLRLLRNGCLESKKI